MLDGNLQRVILLGGNAPLVQIPEHLAVSGKGALVHFSLQMLGAELADFLRAAAVVRIRIKPVIVLADGNAALFRGNMRQRERLLIGVQERFLLFLLFLLLSGPLNLQSLLSDAVVRNNAAYNPVGRRSGQISRGRKVSALFPAPVRDWTDGCIRIFFLHGDICLSVPARPVVVVTQISGPKKRKERTPVPLPFFPAGETAPAYILRAEKASPLFLFTFTRMRMA